MFNPNPIEDRFYQHKRKSSDLIYTGYTPYTATPQDLLGQKQLPTQRQSPRNPYPELPLQTGLDISYQSNLEKAQKQLDPYGYKLDQSISTQENKAFYNPYSNKLVFTVAGTNPLAPRDIATDLYLAFAGNAGLKATNRYKEAETALNQARAKYPKAKTTLAAHSLGASIISNLANPTEQVRGFGKGSGLFSPITAPLEKSYRTFGDPLSYTSGAQNIPAFIPKKTANLRANQQVNYPKTPHSYSNLSSGSYFI